MTTKPILKVVQTDFWPGFPYESNYMLDTLKTQYEVMMTDKDPDLVLYSCYGKDYLKYSCHRVQFISENIRPDFTASDFIFGFDYNTHKNYYRLPLYFFYMLGNGSKEKLRSLPSREEAISTWKSKTKFCCLVVSNGLAKERIQFFKKLSEYKQCDSGGRFMNNIGGPVADKAAYIKDYRFVIAFENSAYPGYTTEKILEPLLANSIPVYWGNPLIDREFNLKRIVVAEDRRNFSIAIEQIKMIDQQEELAIQLLQQPVFNNNELPGFLNENNFQHALLSFVASFKTTRPVAQTSIKHLHTFKRKKNTLLAILNSRLNRNFR